MGLTRLATLPGSGRGIEGILGSRCRTLGSALTHEDYFSFTFGLVLTLGYYSLLET